jgi:hypothetical protein
MKKNRVGEIQYILLTGIICAFIMLHPPAGEGWGRGSRKQIMTVDSIKSAGISGVF